MPDALLRLFAHPVAIPTHILGKSCRPRPKPFCILEISATLRLCERNWPHRLPPCELRRNLNHRLVNHHGDRIQIACIALEPQPLRLQRQRTTACERIVERWQLLRVEARLALVHLARFAPRLTNLLTRLLQHFFIVRVFPLHKLFDYLEKPVPLLCCRASPVRGWVLAVLLQGVIHHLRENDRPRRCKRTPRPPKMKR